MENQYGYERVSSVDQNEARQRVELLKWGIAETNIYSDKVSGKNFDRPEYQKLRRRLKAGDVLVVKSIDRLGRNYRDIQEEWRFLVQQKKIHIVIIDMPLLDTRAHRDLMGTLISDIVLQLLSYVAETERDNIRQRQAEGIAVARQRGVRFGRPAHPIPEGFASVYREWKDKRLTAMEAMVQSGLNKNQFYWMVRKFQKELEDAQPRPVEVAGG